MLKVNVNIKIDRDELKDTIYSLDIAALKLDGSYESELLIGLRNQLKDELGVIDDKLRDTFASPSDDDESYESDDDSDESDDEEFKGQDYTDNTENC